MTDALREAAQAALDELQMVSDYWNLAADVAQVDKPHRFEYCVRQRDRVNERVAALRAALAEPVPEPVAVPNDVMRDAPDRNGIYAWISGISCALVLVNQRPSQHSLGGQLNGHVMNSTPFYDGCAVADWGRDGKWMLLHDLSATAKSPPATRHPLSTPQWPSKTQRGSHD